LKISMRSRLYRNVEIYLKSSAKLENPVSLPEVVESRVDWRVDKKQESGQMIRTL
jgi:hypothetical protein